MDLLLVTKNLLYSSKGVIVFEYIKFNIIKFNVSEVFSLMTKHYQQGDFLKLVFEKGIILVDIKR